MTSTTLTRTGSTQLDANGNGTITLRPDVGQNWSPLFVRISTASSKTPVAYCAVYHGSPGVPIQQSQFIDDTFTANGDASSIIAGTPVLYGEAIIFSFQGGNAKDTAIASVFGMQSDLPPNLDLTPQVPGTHFSGHLSTEIVRDIDASFAGVSLGPGVFFTSSVFDVRLFGSYYLELYALTSSNPATGFNAIQVLLNWYTDAGQSVLMFQDTYEWWADNQTGGVLLLNTMGNVMIQDTMHGPYMTIQLFNNDFTDTVRVQYVLKGTTRTGLPLSVRQQNAQTFFGAGVDGLLLDVNAGHLAGGAANVPMALGYGTVAFELINNPGPNPMSVFISFGSVGLGAGLDNDFIGVVPPSSAIGRNPPLLLTFPKRAGMLRIVGTGTDQFSSRVISSFVKG